ncbi:flavoprotein family protein [Oribacterium sp. oral taxon 078 str. F0262]|uniref:NAD(P)/FAD-dependent oxidoreductase n=1 Tax=Oribacterium sp. oral taxon 078 TaxID=652706 RepID=UPI0001CDF0B1|nr:aminoacetone oxidase family FAD-binding enzyme [Oribacterium sp. oral taxon 078]EFE92232.1 flavoprotein family protein [Oribacterium sp. oral taxon 078 str. F0262]
MRRVIVAGGGAAGMAAAIASARCGAGVLLLERNQRLGKKLSQTGNGRCNFTNRDFSFREGIYRSETADFPERALQGFGPEEMLSFMKSVLSFMKSVGIFPRFRGNYVYPASDQASSVSELMEEELRQLGVKILTGHRIEKIQRDEGGSFLLLSSSGEGEREEQRCDALILALGSAAAPRTGSEGDGYPIAESFGHSIVPLVPALCALRCEESFYRELSGVRCDAALRLLVSGREKGRERGELQLTDYGISGIPVFQLSRYASYGILRGEEVFAELDFLPAVSEDALLSELFRLRQSFPERSAHSLLLGLMNGKLAGTLLLVSGIGRGRRARDLSGRELHALSSRIKSFRSRILSANPFSQAQCAAGGVSCREIEPESMESRICPGLYFAGELLDVDGICGGYNLHFAFASGLKAGRAAAGKPTSWEEKISLQAGKPSPRAGEISPWARKSSSRGRKGEKEKGRRYDTDQ